MIQSLEPELKWHTIVINLNVCRVNIRAKSSFSKTLILPKLFPFKYLIAPKYISAKIKIVCGIFNFEKCLASVFLVNFSSSSRRFTKIKTILYSKTEIYRHRKLKTDRHLRAEV